MSGQRMISLPEALVLVAALFVITAWLIAWDNARETCDGKVVKNMVDWPTCVETTR